jgi:iron(III) transport system permease protein
MSKKRKIRDIWSLVTLLVFVMYLVFFLYPVIAMMIQSIYTPDSGFTLENFKKFFDQPYYMNTILNSFKVTAWVTVLSVAIGTPLAYFMNMYRIKGRKGLQIVIILATMSAPFIGAYSWILLLGRSGVITRFFLNTFGIETFSIYGFNGILLALTMKLFPLVFLYVQGALKNIDNSLMEASDNMGCIGIKRFFVIVIPLIKPTLLAGALLVFMRAFADFGTPMLIGEGYRTFPQLIYTQFISEVGGDVGFASAIAVIAITITACVFLIQRYLSNRNPFTMNALHSIEVKQLKGVKNWIIHGIIYTVVFVAILPQFYVFYTSFKNTSGLIFVPGYSLNSYHEAFRRLGSSIQNTFLIPGTALLIVILMAILIAYITVRRRNPFTTFLDTVSMIPYIIPGSVMGIALVSAFSKPPLLLTGGYLIMIMALVIRRLPYTIRSSAAILQKISISIEEAAISLGASNLKTFFKITMPMMATGIVSGAILSWVTMISELSTAIILYTTRSQTLTVAIYTQIIRGNYGIAAALSTILNVVTIISLLVFMKVSKGKDLSI